MTLLGSVLAVRDSIENPVVPLSSPRIIEYLNGPKSTSGVHVTEGTSLGMPAVWRSVTLIAGTCASLPLKAYRRGDDSRQPLASGYVADLLDGPHPDTPPYEFWETVYAHVLLWGNAYIRVLRNSLNQPKELWAIHPSRVRAGRTSSRYSDVYSDVGVKVYEVDGGDTVLTDAELLHIPGFGYDGICGVSPIRIARQGVGLALAAEEYGARLFGNGSLATGILQTEQRLTEEQADTLHARWRAKRAGLDKAHEVVVLDKGAKFTQLSIPPQDAQFVESRRFQITEVGRMFGVPPFLLYETEKSTSWGTGLEQQALGWVKYDLRRWYIRVEQRLTKMLGPKTTYVRYNVEGLLRGDTASRSAWYSSLWQVGALSTNDIRELEDQPPVDGGDMRYRPLNFGRLGEADTVTTQKGTADAIPA